MKLWILLIWLSAEIPSTSIFTYSTEAECLHDASAYKRAACVQVTVPRK